VIGSAAVETENVLLAYRHWKDFDVIHDHTVVGLGVAPFVERPVVHTVHGAVLPDIYSLYSRLPNNVHLVGISENQRQSLPPLTNCSVISNAIDTSSVLWSEQQGEYLLFVGRAAPEKGPADAIRIADAARMPLRLLLKVNEPAEHEYFEYLQPELRRIGAQVDLDVSEEEKQKAYAGAFATLFPIDWEEPFGLVMIESMAAGTPVIGYARGSVPEVIEDGVTGFVCTDVEEATAAVLAVPALDRRACRERVVTHFDAEIALDQHETLYATLAGIPINARAS
jgi:glycosyltransferase involved in cell wall biosynthesis